MKITLSGTPPSLNRFAGRKNVWTYREEKDRWTRAVYLAALSEMGARRQAPPEFAEVRIRYYFRDRRRRDPDNYNGKFLLDGLTRAGAIMDDDFSHVRVVLSGGVDGKNPRTEIEVEEAREWESITRYPQTGERL